MGSSRFKFSIIKEDEDDDEEPSTGAENLRFLCSGGACWSLKVLLLVLLV